MHSKIVVGGWNRLQILLITGPAHGRAALKDTPFYSAIAMRVAVRDFGGEQ